MNTGIIIISGKNQPLVIGVVHNSEEYKKVVNMVKDLAGPVPVEFALHDRLVLLLDL